MEERPGKREDGWSKQVMSHGGLQYYVSPVANHASRVRRFGFTLLDELRRNFCHSQCCTSANTMPYIFNLMCATKCPELYLPHRTTTESTTAKITSTTLADTTTITPLPAQGPNLMPQPTPEMSAMPQSGSGTDGTSQRFGPNSNRISSFGSSTGGTSPTGPDSNTKPSSGSSTDEMSLTEPGLNITP
ncbi:hypothetical protein ALC60_02150 [Trachymyrmex zeteki]|uniref:Uncharacterized protein n=1 Tax=Mycetomoellerius zeteki TaxID=64791 RepID=A0A151XEQ0_9HYME|nr:hypothetical protein ALC60_02150 [Trachymyrmex zeteki]